MPTNIKFTKGTTTTDIGNLPGFIETKEEAGLETLLCRFAYEGSSREDTENYIRGLVTALGIGVRSAFKKLARSSTALLDNGNSGTLEKYDDQGILNYSLANTFPFEILAKDEGGIIVRGTLTFVRIG